MAITSGADFSDEGDQDLRRAPVENEYHIRRGLKQMHRALPGPDRKDRLCPS